jgi:hypothetical protein
MATHRGRFDSTDLLLAPLEIEEGMAVRLLRGLGVDPGRHPCTAPSARRLTKRPRSDPHSVNPDRSRITAASQAPKSVKIPGHHTWRIDGMDLPPAPIRSDGPCSSSPTL